MITTDTLPDLKSLVHELRDRTILQYDYVPGMASRRHGEIEQTVAAIAAELEKAIREDCEGAARHFRKDGGIVLSAVEEQLLKQLEKVLDPAAANDSEKKIAEFKTAFSEKIWAFALKLYNSRGESSLVKELCGEFLRKTLEEERRYVQECYEKIDLPKTSAMLSDLLKEPYRVEIDDGEIMSAPEVLRDFPYYHLGWFSVSKPIPAGWGPKDDSATEFPLLLSRDKVNFILCPDDSFGREISDIVSNVIYQNLLFQLPDTEVYVCNENSGLPPFLGGLDGDNLLKDHISRFESMAEMSRALDNRKRDRKQMEDIQNARKQGLRCLDLHIIAVLNGGEEGQHEHQRYIGEWRRLIEAKAGEIPAGLSFTYIMPQRTYDELAPFKFDNVAVMRIDQPPAPPEGMAGYETSAPCWSRSWSDAADPLLSVNILKAIVQPPPKRRRGTMRLMFAQQASEKPYYLTYNAENLNSIFMAGMPGAGKSYALKQFILNSCETHSPAELEMILVDLKAGVELTGFAGLPHVRYVISAEGDILNGVFNDITAEMTRRYKLFGDVSEKFGKQCKDILDYNEILSTDKNVPGRPLPVLLVVIDECKSIFEDKNNSAIQKMLDDLLRKCRAAGIHFLFATQTDLRNTLDKALFSHFVRLLKREDGRREVKLNDEIPLVFPAVDERTLGPERVAAIAERYRDFPCEALQFNSTSLLDVGKFKFFRTQYDEVVSRRERTGKITVPAGIDYDHIRRMFAIEFSSRYSQNLFVAGDFGETLEGFFNLTVCSLLRQGCRVSFFDPEEKISALQDAFGQCDKFDYTTENDVFASLVQRWRDTADGKGDAPHFLFVASADTYFRTATPAKKSGGGFSERMFRATAEISPARDTSAEKIREKELFARAANDRQAQRQAFDFMLSKKPAAEAAPVPSAPADPPEAQRPALDYAETAAVLKEYAGKASTHGHYLVLQTATPSAMSDYLVENDLKNFRFAVFYFAARPLSTRMLKPMPPSTIGVGRKAAVPIAYFSETQNTEDIRDTFLVFAKFDPGAYL